MDVCKTQVFQTTLRLGKIQIILRSEFYVRFEDFKFCNVIFAIFAVSFSSGVEYADTDLQMELAEIICEVCVPDFHSYLHAEEFRMIIQSVCQMCAVCVTTCVCQ
jgi:hypothetical protein